MPLPKHVTSLVFVVTAVQARGNMPTAKNVQLFVYSEKQLDCRVKTEPNQIHLDKKKTSIQI